MALENPFVSYSDRSYNQIKAAVVAILAILVPEVTDHNESNPLIRLLSVWAGIAEMLGYYLDNMARETFITQVRLFRSGVKIGEGYDYRIASAQPASALMQITYQNTGVGLFPGITIPAGTLFQTDGGLSFFTVDSLVFPASSLNTIVGTVSAIQEVQQTGIALGLSDGTENQRFVLPTNVSGFSASALVAAVVWTGVETRAFSGPTDQVFVQTVNTDKNVIIRFGDDVNGEIPGLGSAITVDYTETFGAEGNVDANTIVVNSLVPPVGFTVSVTNPSRAAGGISIEELSSLRRNIPYLIRTQNRAVTEQDYIDIGNLHPQVAQTSIDFDCGTTVPVYIVPVGGGIASPAILSSVQDWFNERRLVGTEVLVLAAGEIRIQLDATVRIAPNFIQANVLADVESNLLTFFSVENQLIGGTLHIGDIYQVIENTSGVTSSTVNAVIPVPYARPEVGNTTVVLSWTPILQPASTDTNEWLIIFTSASVFQLFKNGNFIGVFSVGSTVSETEVEFVITGAYVIGDQFSFFTYAYQENDLILAEQSIPIALVGDIVLTPEGGQ